MDNPCPGSDVGKDTIHLAPGLECTESGLDRWLLGADTMACGAMPKRHPSDTRRARSRPAVWLAGFALVLLFTACNEGNGAVPCLPEDVERCSCDDGRDGFQVCDPDGGAGYGACNCDLDASPYLPEAGEVEASTDGAQGEGSGGDGGLSFMSTCSTQPGSPACPPGTSCDDFPAKGQFCSKPCTEATDCPPPSPGCNNMGICKAP